MNIDLAWLPIKVSTYPHFFMKPRPGGGVVERPNSYMFVQDVIAYTAPYTGRDSKSRGNPFQWEGNAAAVEAACECFRAVVPLERHGRSGDVADKLVRQIAERLPWFGRLLVDLRPATRTESSERRSRECHDWWTPRLGSHFVQFGVSRQGYRIAVVIGLVHRDNVLDVRVPRSLGGVLGFKALCNGLDRFDISAPRYWMNALHEGKAEINVDHRGYRVRATAYRDRVSRLWGWHGRDNATTQFKSEYFCVRRHLCFLRATSLLRDSVVGALNCILKNRKIDARIVAVGLPSRVEIEEALGILEAGAATMTEALNKANGIQAEEPATTTA